MTEIKPKLSLDRLTTYQITVPGLINKQWTSWRKEITVAVGLDDDGLPTTSLIVTVDQAGLQGLLRRLYSFGLPLLSVNIVETP
jgi:hypothetical protein